MRSGVRALLAKLWGDDQGALIASEYLALGTVVVLGGIGGLVSIRDAQLAESEEFARSVRQMRQTYQAPGLRSDVGSKAGSGAVDAGQDPALFVP